MRHVTAALRRVVPSLARGQGLLVEAPATRWEDIGGLAAVKQVSIRTSSRPSLFPTALVLLTCIPLPCARFFLLGLLPRNSSCLSHLLAQPQRLREAVEWPLTSAHASSSLVPSPRSIPFLCLPYLCVSHAPLRPDVGALSPCFSLLIPYGMVPRAHCQPPRGVCTPWPRAPARHLAVGPTRLL